MCEPIYKKKKEPSKYLRISLPIIFFLFKKHKPQMFLTAFMFS